VLEEECVDVGEPRHRVEDGPMKRVVLLVPHVRKDVAQDPYEDPGRLEGREAVGTLCRSVAGP
jgi:hypothetical protein